MRPVRLAAAGLEVERHADHFPDAATDQDWLTAAGQRGWYAIRHDKRIRWKPNEQRAVLDAGVRLFVLFGKATHAELADRAFGHVEPVEPGLTGCDAVIPGVGVESFGPPLAADRIDLSRRIRKKGKTVNG